MLVKNRNDGCYGGAECGKMYAIAMSEAELADAAREVVRRHKMNGNDNAKE